MTGSLAICYGMAVFIFLPPALIGGNIGVMLTIFFLILVTMIFGLAILSINV